eukprot:scaffold8732_cov133-Isochrysis_galbana.AAC.4
MHRGRRCEGPRGQPDAHRAHSGHPPVRVHRGRACGHRKGARRGGRVRRERAARAAQVLGHRCHHRLRQHEAWCQQHEHGRRQARLRGEPRALAHPSMAHLAHCCVVGPAVIEIVCSPGLFPTPCNRRTTMSASASRAPTWAASGLALSTTTTPAPPRARTHRPAAPFPSVESWASRSRSWLPSSSYFSCASSCGASGLASRSS